MIRLALLSAQYRQPLSWTDSLLEQSKAKLDRLYRKHFEGIGDRIATVPETVLDGLKDDLGTPQALAMWYGQGELVTPDGHTQLEGARLLAAGRIFGIFEQDKETWFKGSPRGLSSLDPDSIGLMVDHYRAARTQRNWADADTIRGELANFGIEVSVAKDGTTTWRRA